MKTKEVTEECLEEVVLGQKELILHNDDYNTFDHVIDCLVAVCKHDVIQAEQCAYLVHHVGKCTVKKGPADAILKMYKELKYLNLTVEIK
tara:strand:- start:497 stop:766 length:270 start_codon:yes stop_codon:yes gene_type:complete